MSRLKKEAEKRAKALRKERVARAAERRNSRRAKKEEGRREKSDEGEDDVDSEGTGEEKDEEKDEEEEQFDPEEGLLFVYVCSHAAVVTKGKGVAGTYFVTADTSWKGKEQLAKTAVLLETFAASIAGIQVNQHQRRRPQPILAIIRLFSAVSTCDIRSNGLCVNRTPSPRVVFLQAVGGS